VVGMMSVVSSWSPFVPIGRVVYTTGGKKINELVDTVR